MSKAFPTPWTFEAEDEFDNTPIRAANGEYVLVRDNGVYPPDLETCREIVAAVNERDRLRDIMRRLVEYADAVTGYRPCTIEVLSSKHPARTFDGASLLREARAAIRGKTK